MGAYARHLSKERPGSLVGTELSPRATAERLPKHNSNHRRLTLKRGTLRQFLPFLTQVVRAVVLHGPRKFVESA